LGGDGYRLCDNVPLLLGCECLVLGGDGCLALGDWCRRIAEGEEFLAGGGGDGCLTGGGDGTLMREGGGDGCRAGGDFVGILECGDLTALILLGISKLTLSLGDK